MKKFISIAVLLCLLLSMCSCSKQEPENNAVDTVTTEAVINTTPGGSDPINMSGVMTAVSLPAKTEISYADDGTEIFRFTQQNITLTLSAQAAADHVIVDFLNKIDAVSNAASNILASAQGSYYEQASSTWIPYFCQVLYQPTRIDRGVLSLSGTIVTYTGGVHPETSCVSANYNLLTGDVLTLGSILTGEDAIESLRDLVIQHLDEIALDKQLYSSYAEAVTNRFARDVSHDEAWYFSQSGLCFPFSPYEIAPYSSGVIVSEVPYNELVGIIMDDFFPAEQQLLTGIVNLNPFDPQDASRFQQISECIIDSNGSMYLISCDSSVQFLRVRVENTSTNASYVAYAAEYLNPDNAVMIQFDPNEEGNIVIEYISNNENQLFNVAQ